ncbi:hypothetical protein [Sphingomonas sp.]|uniref:hypothetical protein n=1 Tax=Sphingomonas sp. TaxID=28214 RepID=UPI003CC60A8D
MQDNQASAHSSPSVALKPRSQAETTAMFHRLRELKGQSQAGADKHVQAIVLISALIEEGVDAGRGIVGALVTLGFNRKHAGMMLQEGKGNDPARHRWACGDDGQYRLLT